MRRLLNRNHFFCPLFVLLCLLFAGVRVSSQEPGTNEIVQKLAGYKDQTFREKLFVHTDRNAYVAGDIIWFKVYCTEAANLLPASVSKVAYIEILDKDRQPVLQGMVDLKDGTGSGSFIIPSTVSSGNFLLRAYTSWMKNFDPELYYHQNMTIVNTIKADFKEVNKVEATYDAGFFPEGGNLVDELESKVAFRVTDQTGKGIPFHGVIIGNDKDTLAYLQPVRFGIGSFMFTPRKGVRYKVMIKTNDGTSIPALLPPSLAGGYTLQLKGTPNDAPVKIIVRTNTSEQNAFLLIHNRQRVTFSRILAFQDGIASIEIDKKDFDDGISSVTLFNAANKPVCERLFFKKAHRQLRISASTDASSFGRRKKVTVHLSATDESQLPVNSEMSMAVFQLDTISSQLPSIEQYFSLSSELRGAVESPAYYFTNDNAETAEATDNLMLTHGWRKFTWENEMDHRESPSRFLPEFEGHIVSGKIEHKYSGRPGTGIIGYLSVPGPRFQLYSGKSDGGGNIYFNTRNFYGPALIVGLIKNPESDSFRLDFASPFSEAFSSWTPPQFSLPNTSRPAFLRRSINMQVENLFAGDKRQILETTEADTAHFFGTSRFQYLLDDYTRFPTMEEVLREYVREVNVRKRGDNFTLTNVTRDEFGLPVIKEPVVLLDGVPQFDNGNKISHYDPLKVKKLEVVQDRYFLGPASFDGIISFTTYNGDLEGFRLDTTSTALDYEGLQWRRTFFSPVYETPAQYNSRLPDFRNLLYWSPDVSTDTAGKKELSFYTSDRPGKYAVVLQGMTKTGRQGSQVFTIDVLP